MSSEVFQRGSLEGVDLFVRGFKGADEPGRL